MAADLQQVNIWIIMAHEWVCPFMCLFLCLLKYILNNKSNKPIY